MKMNSRVETRPYKDALKEAVKKRPDSQRVSALLNKAMHLGDPNAFYALATWYLNGVIFEKNIKKAIPLLIKAAKGMVPAANYDLAIAYEKGAGVTKSKKRAFELYLTAALLGEEAAILETGRCYYYGIGTRRDTGTAKIWLQRAKQLGVSRRK
jgi:hypothetical protein